MYLIYLIYIICLKEKRDDFYEEKKRKLKEINNINFDQVNFVLYVFIYIMKNNVLCMEIIYKFIDVEFILYVKNFI